MAAVLLQLVASAAISLTPGSGSTGSAFAVAGQGFVPGDRVRVFWDGTNLGGNTQIEGDGSFSYEATVPVGAAPGVHTVEARSRQGGSAFANFEVVESATTTSPPPTPSTSTFPTLPPATTLAAPAGSPGTDPATSVTSGSTAPTETTENVAETTAAPAAIEVTTSTGGIAAGSGSSAVGGIAAALAAATLAGGLLKLLSRTKARLATSEPAVPGTAAVTETGTVPIPPPAVTTRVPGWERDVLDLPGAGRLERLVDRDGEFLAVGQATRPGPGTAAVWASGDGRSWQLLKELGTGNATCGLPWRDGILVLGLTEEPTGAVGWVWRLDQEGWRRLSDPGDQVLAGLLFDGAAALDAAVVAYGRGPNQSGAWATEDGGRWEQARLRGSVDLVAAVNGTFVAFGRDPIERRATVARSTDGFAWSELNQDASFVFEGAAIAAATAFEGGIVAAGVDKMRGSAAVWVSDEGRRWLRTPFREEVGTSIQYLAPVGDRLLAVGVDLGPKRTGRVAATVVWDSTDGVSWQRLNASDLFAHAVVTSLNRGGQALIMAGKLLAGPASPWTQTMPAIWIHDPLAELQRSSGPLDALLAR
jgi:hypothetical protein